MTNYLAKPPNPPGFIISAGNKQVSREGNEGVSAPVSHVTN